MAPITRLSLWAVFECHAYASETCAASNSCAEETTLLQGMNHMKKAIRHDVAAETKVAAKITESVKTSESTWHKLDLRDGWVAASQGNQIGNRIDQASTVEECEAYCDANELCHSIRFGSADTLGAYTICGTRCFLFDQSFAGDEDTIDSGDSDENSAYSCWNTFYKNDAVSETSAEEYQHQKMYWPQHDADLSKCNNNVDLQLVTNQYACQQVAVANGHPYYSFRHNEEGASSANAGLHKCFSSSDCEGVSWTTINEWNIYASVNVGFWTLGEAGNDCDTACEAEGGTCDQDAIGSVGGERDYQYEKTGTAAAITEMMATLGETCVDTVAQGASTPSAPRFGIRSPNIGSCQFRTEGGSMCAAAAGGFQRLCWCVTAHDTSSLLAKSKPQRHARGQGSAVGAAPAAMKQRRSKEEESAASHNYYS